MRLLSMPLNWADWFSSALKAFSMRMPEKVASSSSFVLEMMAWRASLALLIALRNAVEQVEHNGQRDQGEQRELPVDEQHESQAKDELRA